MYMNRNRMMFKHLAIVAAIQALRGDGGGDDDKDKTPPKIDPNSPEFKAAVEAATSPLKKKNEELMDELKKAKPALTALQELGGVDEIKKIFDMVGKNEELQLLKDGKVDEVVSKRLDKAKSQYEQTIKQLTEERDAALGQVDGYKGRYKKKLVSDALRDAAVKAGVRPEALEDVVMQGSGIFTVGEDDEPEARDSKGNLVKIDDKLLTPALFVENLKKTRPHYWPASKGSGSEGDNDYGGGSDLEAKMREALANGDMKKYRELRTKKK